MSINVVHFESELYVQPLASMFLCSEKYTFFFYHLGTTGHIITQRDSCRYRGIKQIKN